MKFTVDKHKLLATLGANREAHAAAYQEAMVKYREKSIEFFELAMEKIRSGGEVERTLRLPMPEEHTDDFDRVIEGLTWQDSDMVELTEGEFEELVRNRWGWHKTFVQNTTSYLAS